MASKITWGLYAADFVFRKKLHIKMKYSKRDMLSVSEASHAIEEKLLSGKPFMAGRMGFFEQAVLRMYEFGKKDKYETVMNNIYNCAGFFPNDTNLGYRFTEVMKDAYSVCDILACNYELLENYFINFCMPKDAKVVESFDINDVCRDETNWSKALKGKKVLVVTPFTDSVKQQYEKRDKLFLSNPDILPEFELITYKSLMTVGDLKDDRFSNWFEALKFMENEILSMDFDVALLGCGAYGFPLAAAIKMAGRQAIHLGGTLQLLFGIMGRRWDGSRFGGIEHMPEYISRYYNENWTYPIEGKPQEASKVEYGPYWK